MAQIKISLQDLNLGFRAGVFADLALRAYIRLTAHGAALLEHCATAQ
jgi:hypothetical protein